MIRLKCTRITTQPPRRLAMRHACDGAGHSLIAIQQYLYRADLNSAHTIRQLQTMVKMCISFRLYWQDISRRVPGSAMLDSDGR